jgi:hypothetical protein
MDEGAKWAKVCVWVERLKLDPNQKKKLFDQLVVCEYITLKDILDDDDDEWFSQNEADLSYIRFSLKIRRTLKKAVQELRVKCNNS